jgi:hypothetical protein
MDTLTDDPVPDKPRRRGSFKAFVSVVFIVLALLTGIVVVAYRPFVTWWIQRDALARGFVIDFSDFLLEPDRISLSQLTVKLVGVSGVEARFGKLTVDLQGIEPLRIEGTDAHVDVTGSPDELQQTLVSFGKAHAQSVHLPTTINGEFRYGGPDNPSVLLSGKAKSVGEGDVTFDGTFQVFQTKLGTLALHRSMDNKVDVGLGLTLSDKPVVNVSLDVAAVPFTGSVKFPSQKIDDVCRAFALPIPKGFSGSSAEGSITFVLDGALPSNPHHGTAAFVLTGWVPPHPRELDGLVYGNTTKLGTTFEVLPDLNEVRFTKATVDAGALHLEGKGNSVREGLSARTKMDLAGNVACTELGASAIGSHVHGIVGDVLRSVARMTIGGTVKIRVIVDADTKSLSAAKVDQSVDIGCRLR